jgi:hypothetical protein
MRTDTEPDTRPQTPKPQTEEAKRFLEAAKHVFNVPKEEIDRREAAYQKNKPHKRGNGRTNGKAR